MDRHVAGISPCCLFVDVERFVLYKTTRKSTEHSLKCEFRRHKRVLESSRPGLYAGHNWSPYCFLRPCFLQLSLLFLSYYFSVLCPPHVETLLVPRNFPAPFSNSRWSHIWRKFNVSLLTFSVFPLFIYFVPLFLATLFLLVRVRAQRRWCPSYHRFEPLLRPS